MPDPPQTVEESWFRSQQFLDDILRHFGIMAGKWSGYDESGVLSAAMMVLGGYRMSFLEKC